MSNGSFLIRENLAHATILQVLGRSFTRLGCAPASMSSKERTFISLFCLFCGSRLSLARLSAADADLVLSAILGAVLGAVFLGRKSLMASVTIAVKRFVDVSNAALNTA